MNKIVKILILVSVLVLVSCFTCACSTMTTITDKTIDRIVVGQLSSIDTVDEYSILHFTSNLEIIVTTQSLTNIVIARLFESFRTYNLHFERGIRLNDHLYSIVSISQNAPDYNTK